MPFIPAPNILQTELVYTLSGQNVQNVLHYLSPISPTVPSMSLFAAAVLDWWDTDLQTYVCAAAQLQEIRITDLTTQTASVVNYGVSLPQIGGRAGNINPNNVTVVFTKRTALRGRSYRGRLYWPGINTEDTTQNNVSLTLVNAILTGLEAGKTLTTADGDYEMGVLSRYAQGLPRTTATLAQVTGFTSDGVVDSQRRRLPGRGN